ncbi:YkgJ family cysteine cluster protein [Stutzerimonas azotifigens]|uniref:YkgJ family cysteine cluster protein n=1 Tax=Stutzerimonas azotifigens TaxID=291995 RepID=UPI00040B418F|nr:YkgJ family cysteine cluster protein [Stutzerimonas azotifigens]
MKRPLIAPADPDRLDTWARYAKGLCRDCRATCCSLPVEVGIEDLIRLELADPFERDEPPRQIARRLMKAGVVEHFNQKQARFTLARHSSGDCLFLDRQTRLCTVYARRPDTCRNHPQIGPRPGYCAYQPKTG